MEDEISKLIRERNERILAARKEFCPENTNIRLFGEASLDDFNIGSMDDIDTSLDDGAGGGSSKTTTAPDDLSIPDAPSFDGRDLDISMSTDPTDNNDTSLDFEDIDKIPEMSDDDIAALADDTPDVTGDISGDMSDDDLDKMINGLDDEISGNTEKDNNDENNSYDPNANDDTIEDSTEDDQADDLTIRSSSPELESSRKYRLVKTMEKLYNTYGDKIKKFDSLQLPLDKERIYKLTFDRYVWVFDLMKDYIEGSMSSDDSFTLTNRIVQFATLFSILDTRLKLIKEHINSMQK